MRYRPMTRTFIILLLFMTVNLMQRNRCEGPNKALRRSILRRSSPECVQDEDARGP